MISVLRQLPRNSSTIAAVSAAAISASMTTPLTAALTNTDWSNSGVTLTSCGSICDRARQQRAQVGDDVERRGAAVLQHRQQHAARAVLAHDVGLRREAVAHLGDVAQVGGRAARRVRTGRSFRPAIASGEPFMRTVYSVLAELGGARGQDQVLRVDRVDHVGRRQAARLQRLACRGRPRSARFLPP